MPKKGENIYKRKDGRWEGRYILNKKTSEKVVYKSVYGRSYLETKKKLIELKYIYQHSKQKNITNVNGLMIETICYEWLHLKKPQIKESSFIKYVNIVENYIIYYLGSVKLKKITRLKLELFINSLLERGGKKKQALSAKTVSDIFSVLKRILEYASQKYKIVLCNFKNLKIRLSKKPVRILNKDEHKRLIEYLLKHLNKINMGILLVLFTGIRIGELCALQYKNILIDEAALIVSGTLQRIQNKNPVAAKKTKIILTTPKSLSSVRKIPIPSLLMPLIKKIYGNGEGFLLTGSVKKFVEPRTVQNHFRTILRCAQINQTNFHILRHTFATQCLISGMDIKSLSEILGHSNINITLNKYVHPSFEEKKQFIDKLGCLLTVK